MAQRRAMYRDGQALEFPVIIQKSLLKSVNHSDIVISHRKKHYSKERSGSMFVTPHQLAVSCHRREELAPAPFTANARWTWIAGRRFRGIRRL